MTEPLWTATDAIAATGGSCDQDWRASGVSIDTRTLAAGDLFVAIRGPNFDGHAFAAPALRAGAAAVLIDRSVDTLPADAPQLIVADTERALEDLGRAARARTGGRLIAVTGSVGKTGVKEALRHVLGQQGPTSATIGNLNNQWGLPLSLARMPKDTAYGVFELGMNHPGELTPLSNLARPHVAVITTIASVHRAYFAGDAAIAAAKAEIFEGLEPGGTAVLNRDIPHYDGLRLAALAAGAQRIIDFGADDAARCRVVTAEVAATHSDVQAEILDTDFHYRVGIPGRHWIENSLAVLAAVAAVGADIEQAAEALADLSPPAGRGRCHSVALGDGVLTVVDESYNASPISTGAALETLGSVTPGAAGRRIAVLGDMLELGDDAAAAHAALADAVHANGIDLVFTAGPLMAHLQAALPAACRAGHGADSARVIGPLLETVGADDVVMVKGSAGSRMGRVVEALLNLNATATAAANDN